MISGDEVLGRLMAPLMRGIRLVFGRGVLTGTNDALKIQNLQMTGLDGEVFDEVERPQQYGQISVPLPGAEVFFACLAGQRDQAVALVVEDRRCRPGTLDAGDAGIYHYEGHRLLLTKGGRAVLTCKNLEIRASTRIRLNSPETEITGNVTIQKNLQVQGGFTLHGTGETRRMVTMSDATISGVRYSGHTHHEYDRGGTTGGPQNG